jgi:ubiquinone/menaquinone biosynthesis C-methylase UbiE
MSSPYSDPAMAAIYDCIAARLQFTVPAQDLVEIAAVSKNDAVLDVGTGTGVVAAAARKAIGSDGFIVGVDAAMEMIRHSPRDAGALVLSHVPGLPFRDDSFDVVIAGFVVSHFDRYQDGLAEMIRVCRTAGRVGMSAWGDAANPVAAFWTDIAGQYMFREKLSEVFSKHIPWDTWFSRSENVTEALRSAGLASVITETRYYTVRMRTHEFLLLREASVQGLVLRNELTSSEWDDFRTKVGKQFRDKFGEMVEYRRDVHFGVGTKSGGY